MAVEVPVTAAFVESANAAQLHDEARGAEVEWPASFVEREDGSWVYRVDRDDVDADAIRAAVDGHAPVFAPDPDDELDAALASVDTSTVSDTATRDALDAIVAALRGRSGRKGAAAGRRPSQ
jgi:hypothetical protein